MNAEITAKINSLKESKIYEKIAKAYRRGKNKDQVSILDEEMEDAIALLLPIFYNCEGLSSYDMAVVIKFKYNIEIDEAPFHIYADLGSGILHLEIDLTRDEMLLPLESFVEKVLIPLLEKASQNTEN